MKEIIKTIVIVMNEGETRENVRHHETMDCEDAWHFKTLKLKHQRIKSTKEINHDYIEALMFIGGRLRSISQFF